MHVEAHARSSLRFTQNSRMAVVFKGVRRIGESSALDGFFTSRTRPTKLQISPFLDFSIYLSDTEIDHLSSHRRTTVTMSHRQEAQSLNVSLMPSSPPPRASRHGHGPDDEIPGLVERVQRVDLSPALTTFLSKPENKAAFLDLFSRTVELIRSRSQTFEDGHVTVFDKVLLTLTDNGNTLENPAAVVYYCEEYLNFNVQGEIGDVSRAVERTVMATENLKAGKLVIPLSLSWFTGTQTSLTFGYPL